MTVVDASVWVSSLIPQDVHHQASKDWLAEQIAGHQPLTLPTLALAEIAGAISRRVSRSALGQQAMNEILRLPGIRLVPLDIRLARQAAEVAATYRLRGADAVYVAIAQDLHLPLVTWDQEIENRAAGYIQVQQP